METNLDNSLSAHPATNERRRLSCGIALLTVAALAGCAEKGPTCSDESTVGVVKKIYWEAMTTALFAGANAAAIQKEIESATSVEVRSVRTVGKDEKIGLTSCEASLSVKVPTKFANAVSAPGNPLSMAVQSVSVTVNADRLEKDIQYTSQMTDDGKQVRVLAKGVPEMGQLIAMLVATGMIEINATAAVPTATGAASSPSLSDAKTTGASPTVAETPESVANTRFGVLRIDSEQRVLFKGAPLMPAPEAGNRLRIVKTFEIGDRDAVLLEAINGTACPSTFYMTSVSATGISSTPSFGTCSDDKQVSQAGDSVRINMPGFAGNSQSQAELDAAASEVHVYVYRNGTIAEEGQSKPSASSPALPSFSCAGKLNSVERLVCDTPALADADAKLGRLYAAGLAKAADPAALKLQQRDWRRTRDACGDVACMSEAYSKRNAELAR